MPRAVATDYRSTVRKPDDFDAFWDDVLRQASAIPLEAEIVPDALRTSEDIEVFQVFYESLDNVRVAAWYCRPAHRGERTPAIMLLPGYQMDPPIPKDWARKGYIALSVAPRGKLRSMNQFNPGYPNLLTYNIVDRHTYAYRGFYVDTWRGLDFLLSRPEVDPARLGVTGNSQGGGLTITTAAMRPEVCAASAGAPYLCGFMDAIELTHTYPYEEINDYLRAHPERRADVEATVAYFDGINFADRISCPIIVNIGLQDNVCPPETGYALFDRIGAADKRLYPYDGHGHEAGRVRHVAVVDRFFAHHLLGREERVMARTPDTLGDYWQETLGALARYPASPEIEPLPLRTTAFATLYGVRLTSVGPYRLFGYLSIPVGPGPFPAIYYPPKYQSVLEIIPQGTANRQRSRYITFSLAGRGQRNADTPYRAMFPGLLTDGIDEVASYVFRGIAADGVRGLQFLLTRGELDRARVVVAGNDLALITAALAEGATHVVATPALFHRTAELAARTQAYPLEEINDYLRAHPARAEAVRHTLSRYDLCAFAPRVGATTLLMAGAPGTLLDALALRPLVSALRGPVTVHESEQSSYRDGLYAERWMAAQCGLADVDSILPEHWRESPR